MTLTMETWNSKFMNEAINWAEKYRWFHVANHCIWFNEDTGKYHFSDEAEQMVENPYDTLQECLDAVKRYAEFLHHGPN